MARRPKIEEINAPTLFEIHKLDAAPERVARSTVERPHRGLGLFLGTSAFTANGWPGTFDPAGMKPADMTFYATKFKTVEIDSTYHRPPSLSTVTRWRVPR